GEDVVEMCADRGGEGERCRPRLALIRAARDEDVVEGRAGGLLDARLTCRVDVVEGVRERRGAMLVTRGATHLWHSKHQERAGCVWCCVFHLEQRRRSETLGTWEK